MMIDVTLLFNELDLLEFRLLELDTWVDQFIVLQGEETFSGKPKDLLLDPTADRWAAWRGRLTAVTVPRAPAHAHRWDREFAARDCVAEALTAYAPTDLVLYSDVDEIPNRAVIQSAIPRLAPRAWAGFRLQVSQYYANLWTTEKWEAIALAQVQTVQDMGGRAMREARRRPPIRMWHELGGWHLTYLGGVEAIQEKIHAWTHEEMDLPKFTDSDRIADRMARRQDVFGRKRWRMRPVSVDRLPSTFHTYPTRFATWLLPETEDPIR